MFQLSSMLPHKHYSLTGEADVFESDGVLNTAVDHDGLDPTDVGQGMVYTIAAVFINYLKIWIRFYAV